MLSRDQPLAWALGNTNVAQSAVRQVCTAEKPQSRKCKSDTQRSVPTTKWVVDLLPAGE